MGPCYGPVFNSGGYGPLFCIWYIVGMYWGPDDGPILRAHRKTLGVLTVNGRRVQSPSELPLFTRPQLLYRGLNNYKYHGPKRLA